MQQAGEVAVKSCTYQQLLKLLQPVLTMWVNTQAERVCEAVNEAVGARRAMGGREVGAHRTHNKPKHDQAACCLNHSQPDKYRPPSNCTRHRITDMDKIAQAVWRAHACPPFRNVASNHGYPPVDPNKSIDPKVKRRIHTVCETSPVIKQRNGLSPIVAWKDEKFE
jgi:hypothetical protein